MAKFKGSNNSNNTAQPSWKDYLHQEKSGDEARKENLEERRASWGSLIVPEEGDALRYVALRLAIPQIWLVGGVWLLQVAKGLELFILFLWLMPVIGLIFISWKQLKTSGDWVYTNLFLIAFGLVLASSGVLGVFGK